MSSPQRRTHRSAARGSALVLVLIVLMVLLLLGAASLKLSLGHSASAHRAIDHDVLMACSDAAEKKLWAEFAFYNGAVPAVRPTVIPSGSSGVRMSLAHFDADPDAVTAVSFDEKTFRPLDRNAMSGSLGEMDQTNTFRGEFGGRPYLVVAHCTDAKGRQYELELLVRFGL